jgi:hypothetical protein
MVWLIKYLTRLWRGAQGGRPVNSPKPGPPAATRGVLGMLGMLGMLAHQTANDLRVSLRSPAPGS